MKASKRIFGLDLMRAIAIALVVVSHCLWFFPNSNGISLTLFNFAGYIGVEIFFVLSGFLIGNILYRLFVLEKFDRKKLFNFWKRRWLRTLPNYYLILIINILLTYFLFHDLPIEGWKYIFFIQNFSSEQAPFFYESWSLSIEEFAYIIGPLLLFLSMILPLKRHKSKAFLGVTLIIIIFFTFTKVAFHFSHDQLNSLEWNSQLKSVVIYRIDAIYYGFLAAYFFNIDKSNWNKYKYVFGVIGVVFFLVFNTTLSFKNIDLLSSPFIWNVLFLPLISISIALTIPFFSGFHIKNGSFKSMVTHISLISYSLYLIHYTLVLKLVAYFFPQELVGLKLFGVLGVYLIVVVGTSSLLYRYFEKPFMDFRDKLNSKA